MSIVMSIFWICQENKKSPVARAKREERGLLSWISSAYFSIHVTSVAWMFFALHQDCHYNQFGQRTIRRKPFSFFFNSIHHLLLGLPRPDFIFDLTCNHSFSVRIITRPLPIDSPIPSLLQICCAVRGDRFSDRAHALIDFINAFSISIAYRFISSQNRTDKMPM